MNLNDLYFSTLGAQPLLILLLMLPIVATIVGVARHVIGIKSLGLYAPIILTFAFYVLGLNGNFGQYSDVWAGVRYGIILLAVIIATTLFITTIIRPIRMHYFPKVSFVLAFAALAVFGAIMLAQYLDLTGFSSVSAVALVLLASVAEQFTSILFKKNFKVALLLTIETVLTSILCYLLIAWPSFQQLIIVQPLLVLLTLPINLLLGRYRGLRVREYLRFNEILTENEDQ